MKRGLLLSGGGFRGAVQVPVIKHLLENYNYDGIYGISVGALNGVLAAQDELPLLIDMWSEIDGIEGFLKLKWWYPFGGLYSMKPLRKKLEKHASLQKIKTPFTAGVVSLNTGKYYSLSSKDMNFDFQLWDAIHASSCIVGAMEPPHVYLGNKYELGADGGFRNIIPIPMKDEFDHVDVVTCTPPSRMLRKQNLSISGTFEMFMRGLEILESEVFDKDLLQVRLSLPEHGTATVYSPQRAVGPTFRANKQLIKYRFELGEEAIQHPHRLK